jgi:hypothetical protein
VQTVADIIIDMGKHGRGASASLRWLADWLPGADRRMLDENDLARINAYAGDANELQELLGTMAPLTGPVWFEAEVIAEHGTEMVLGCGAGAIVGGLWLGHSAHSSGLTNVAIGSSLVAALAAIGVSATTSMWFAVPGIAAFGFGVSSAGIAVQTLVQLASDRKMRGRVMGLYGLIFRGAPSMGALIAGFASAHFGLRWPVFIGALFVIAACIWTYVKREQIMAALPTEEADADA